MLRITLLLISTLLSASAMAVPVQVDRELSQTINVKCTVSTETTDGSPFILDYLKIFRSPDQQVWAEIAQVALCDYSDPVANLPNGTYYYHAVIVSKAGKESLPSNVGEAELIGASPPKPSTDFTVY